MAIVVLMLAGGIPMARGLVQSTRRAAAVDGVIGFLERTRSVAIAQGRPAYLAFADSTLPQASRYRAVCIYGEAEDPSQPLVRLTPWRVLPVGFSFWAAPQTPSLLDAPPEIGSPLFSTEAAPPRPLPYIKFNATGSVAYPRDPRCARLFLFNGVTDASGEQDSTGKARESAPAEQIKISMFTGRPRYQFGE